MKLRRATHNDLDALGTLGRAMHGASTYASMDYETSRVQERIAELLDANQFVVVIVDGKHKIVGAMLGVVNQSWFGSDSVANDLALFVDPDARCGMAAVLMIKAFIQWAKWAGAKQIRPGVTTGDVRASVLFEKLGFTRCGACFVMQGD